MPVAKGQSYQDGTYVYTCGNCKGTGFVKDGQCPHCYGGDVEKIKAAMKEGARGQRYYALLKAFLKARGKAIVSEFWHIKSREGKATLFDLGYLSAKHGLNFRATVEWLEECRCVRSGTYDMFARSTNAETGKKWRVKDIYDAVLEKHPELKEADDGNHRSP